MAWSSISILKILNYEEEENVSEGMKGSKQFRVSKIWLL